MWGTDETSLAMRGAADMLVRQLENSNPGLGGWGAVLVSPGHGGLERELYGAEPDTTNNRMELTAAIQALRALKYPCRVELYTDSTYI